MEKKKEKQASMAEYWRKQHEEKISLEFNDQKKLNPKELAINKKVLKEMKLLDEKSDYTDLVA